MQKWQKIAYVATYVKNNANKVAICIQGKSNACMHMYKLTQARMCSLIYMHDARG